MSSDTSLSETSLLEEESGSLNKSRPPVKSNPVRENIKSFAAGGVGGICAVFTGHPFDLIKVRCQNGQANSAVHAVSNILKEARTQVNGTVLTNSIKGFYKGVIPPLLGVTPIFAVSFWGYDVGKKLVSFKNESGGSNELTMGQMAAAGFISAIPTTLVTAPTERVKVVLQTSSKGSFIHAAKTIVKEGGISSLFKGSLATLARDGPGSALYFASYEISKNYLNSRQPHPTAGEDEQSIS